MQIRDLSMRSLAIFKFVLNIATRFPRSYKIIEQTGFDQNDPFVARKGYYVLTSHVVDFSLRTMTARR